MASTKFSKESREFKLFGDFYTVIQKYYIPEDSAEYWASMIDDADKLSTKYLDDDCYDLAVDMGKLIAGFLARKHKRMKK